jgi:beta-glucosidase
MSENAKSPSLTFSKHFTWGAAAASYQIEGAAFDDGKGPSVWDMLCEKPDAVWGNHSGLVACDHYNRYREDVALMQKMGLQAYRLSLSWPRIIPQGRGAINPKGLDFYSRLVDALLEAKITPWVTLFHWDYPLALFQRGGWLNPDSSDWFAEYTATVIDALSDRVEHWITLNEPQVYVGFGHMEGVHAPGIRLPMSQMLLAGHHTLVAHGKSAQVIRGRAKRAPKIGYSPVGMPKHPVSSSAADVEAARRATFCVYEKNSWNNTWWMDPVFLGQYPEQGLAYFGKDVPTFDPKDLETICQPLDFFGVNIYQSTGVRAADNEFGFDKAELPTGDPLTAFNWPVTPEALYWGPKFFHERYQKPIVITENGLSNRDWVSLDGQVHDPARIDFTQRYLQELHKAHAEGVPVDGYFHWSVLDNFEWAAGYRERFGLIHVDYETQVRTLKDSAHWYRTIIESNGAALFPA